MEDLQDLGVGQQRLEIERLMGACGELHQVTDAVAGRELRQTQAVAMRIEAHRLGVDGDAPAEIEARGKVAVMKVDAHRTGSLAEVGAQERTRTFTPRGTRT